MDRAQRPAGARAALRLIAYVESADEAWGRICAHYRLDPVCAKPQPEQG